MIERPNQNNLIVPLEKKLSMLERKRSIIEDIRDNYGILFISLMPSDPERGLGAGGDQEWFWDALGLSGDSNQLTTLNAMTESLPDTVEETGIIIGGSPWAVYDKLHEPWMQELQKFILAMHAQKKPILGVCFGHQLIAHAFGGKVEKNPLGRHYGSLNVDLTGEGKNDPLFRGLPENFLASQSHQDVVTEPPDYEATALLARSDLDPHHAFAFGENTRTVQFHPEITEEMLKKSALFRKDILMKQGFFKNDEEFKEFINDLEDPLYARKVLHNFLIHFVLKK